MLHREQRPGPGTRSGSSLRPSQTIHPFTGAAVLGLRQDVKPRHGALVPVAGPVLPRQRCAIPWIPAPGFAFNVCGDPDRNVNRPVVTWPPETLITSACETMVY